MATEGWLPTSGTDNFGFNLLPAGSYDAGTNTYENYGVSTAIWVAEPGSSIYHACEFGAFCGTWEMIPGNSNMEISVRCICDLGEIPSTTCTGTASSNETSYGGKIATVKDAESNSYHVVEIGNRCWMKENLHLTAGMTPGDGYYYPGNDENNVENFGLLYTQTYAAASCPTGWRLPTSAELTAISSDFSDLELPMAGLYTSTNGYQNFFNHSAYIWSEATGLPNTAYYAATYDFSTAPSTGSMNMNNAASVRCIRNN